MRACVYACLHIPLTTADAAYLFVFVCFLMVFMYQSACVHGDLLYEWV